MTGKFSLSIPSHLTFKIMNNTVHMSVSMCSKSWKQHSVNWTELNWILVHSIYFRHNLLMVARRRKRAKKKGARAHTICIIGKCAHFNSTKLIYFNFHSIRAYFSSHTVVNVCVCVRTFFSTLSNEVSMLFPLWIFHACAMCIFYMLDGLLP